MRIRQFFHRLRDDSGVTAMIVAVMAVALLGAASMAIDISRFTYQRELTRDAMESGAQAGAFYLPTNPASAVDAAVNAAKYVDPAATPVVKLLCVVPYVSGLSTYDSSTVQNYCNPGPVDLAGRYAQSLYPDKKCSSTYGICTLPCTFPCVANTSSVPATVTSGYTFNAISVNDTSEVKYLFGPIMDVFSKSFSSGSHVVAACKGSGCATTSAVPMNIVIVLDRTGSVSDADRRAMVKSIEGMFGLMEPTVQFVALAPMGKSVTDANCLTTAATITEITSRTDSKWVSVPYSANYLTANRALNQQSDIVRKALGLGTGAVGDNCLSLSDPRTTDSNLKQTLYGSFLAASMKSAALYLLDSGNLTGLPARSGAVQNVIFFESDGEPYEQYDLSGTSSTSLDNRQEVWYKSSNLGTTTQQCDNLKTVAENAKAKGITIFSVAFGSDGASCGSGKALAAMAAVAGKYVFNADGTLKNKEVTLPNYTQTSSQVWSSSLTYQGQIDCPSTQSNDPKYATCWTTNTVWNSNNTYASTSNCSGVSSGNRNQTDYPSCYSLQAQWDSTNTYAGTVSCADVSSGSRNATDYPDCYTAVRTWNSSGSMTYAGTVDCGDIKSASQSQAAYPDCYKLTTFNTSKTFSGTVDCSDIKSGSQSKTRYPSCYTWKTGYTYSTSNDQDCGDIATTARGTKSNTRYSACWGSSSWKTSKSYTGTVRCDDIATDARDTLTGTYANCWQWDSTQSNTGTVRCKDISSSAQANYPSCYDVGWDSTKTQTGTVRCADILSASQASYPNCWSMVSQWDTTQSQSGTVVCADISSGSQSAYPNCRDQVMLWDSTLTYPVQKDCPSRSNNSATYDSCWDTTTSWDSNNTYAGTVSCSTVSSGNRSQSTYPTCYSTVWTDTNNCDPAIENFDGDRLFCAATGSDFAGIFQSAFAQLLRNSKFIRLP